MDRREFLKYTVLATGSILLFPRCSFAPSAGNYRVLSNEEAACLVAMCEQIVPADEDPGATDAGVIHFLDRQATIRFPEDKVIYRTGIESLQAYCNTDHGANFEKLGTDTQIDILRRMEAGGLPRESWGNRDQRVFFERVRLRTMQGFYGSPRHGGNKNYVSYRMMKVDYPLLVGQNRY